jgi:hypothetical protein
MINSSLIHDIICSLLYLLWLQCSTHSHFLLEVELGLLVTLLAVLYLLVTLVDQVVACCDVVVPVIFDTLLSILLVEVEFVKDPIEQLVLNRHLLFTWKEAYIPISIFDLE